jgi:class 3 adenylate cyclase
VWETPELALDLIQQFLTGVRRTAEPTRVLATVLFSDIVASTEQANRLGDRRWRGAAEHPRRAGPPVGRGVRRQAGEDDR